MNTPYNLSKIALVALFAAGISALPRCSSDNKPAQNAATDSSARQITQTAPAGNPVERGKYLVTVGGCNDCHSPKNLTKDGPVPDESRLLSGHPADGKIPKFNAKDIRPDNWILTSPDLTTWVGPWGISYPANLTPDSTTGLGAWTADMFIKTLRSGKHMGVETGRSILPPMPWFEIAKMTDDDLNAVFAYLHSLKPVVNKVPAPVAPPDLGKM
jgi:hypothetical protein